MIRFERPGGALWVDASHILAVWDVSPDGIAHAMIDVRCAAGADPIKCYVVRGTADDVIVQLRAHARERQPPSFFPRSSGTPL